MAGQPFNKRGRPPTTGISNHDYAGNFEDFLNSALTNQPWCFVQLGRTARRYEYGSGVAKAKTCRTSSACRVTGPITK